MRDWRDEAACRGMDTTVFITHDGNEVKRKEAFAICDTCPEWVVKECLAWALEHDERGVWGRTTGRTRRNMQRRTYH